MKTMNILKSIAITLVEILRFPILFFAVVVFILVLFKASTSPEALDF